MSKSGDPQTVCVGIPEGLGRIQTTGPGSGVAHPGGMRARFDSCLRRIHWRRDRLPVPVFMGFPGGSAGTAMRET